MTKQAPLTDYRVVDLSSGIAGAYCTKLLADVGAEVIKIESPEGDILRSWTATGAPLDDGEDGALFQFLACSKQSVVAEPDDPAGLDLVVRLLAGSDAVVWSRGSRLAEHPRLSPRTLRDELPHLDVVSITPFGLDGPWAGRVSTEFTLQAWAGAIGHRGSASRPPISVGGRVGEWAAGTYAAVALLASRRRSLKQGVGELLDTSVLEAVSLTLTNMHSVSYFREAGFPLNARRWSVLPGIHPTKDGWVGFMVGTGQQWLDFCVLVERIDWLEDQSLIRAPARATRADEIVGHIEAWAGERTTEEIIELASQLRVPVAPVGSGATVSTFDHFVEQEMFQANPRAGFVQPATPFRLSGDAVVREPGAPPYLGEHTAMWSAPGATARNAPEQAAFPGPDILPFDDVRIVEMTNFWAGPSAGHLFAMLGAEVVKVESPARPDGIRSVSTLPHDQDKWWEHAPLFRATNTGKLGLGARLDTPAGLDAVLKLIENSDAVLENFSPRVLDAWGLDWETVHALNPRLIMVRMPAFGLTGPWRDRTGFAQTMEQASGMAWVTGYPDAEPQVPNGPCDPLAGAHAVFAFEAALAHRDRTGEGTLVEVPMVMSALNVAAEQVTEYSAYGKHLERIGNHGRTASPQDLYRTGDPDDGAGGPFVAVAVETEPQWVALAEILGRTDWSEDSALATVDGRRAREQEIEAVVAQWCASRSADDIVEALWPAGVPVGKVLMPHAPDFTQLEARGFFERVGDPVAGIQIVAGLPVRFSSGPQQLHRRHSPSLGEHNAVVLAAMAGLSSGEIAALDASGAIGSGLQLRA